MSQHHLKTWPEPFAALRSNAKRFEYRRDDRGFAVGDSLILHLYDPARGEYLEGPVEKRWVHYIARGPAYGIPDGFCVMSLGHKRPRRVDTAKEPKR